MDNNKKIQVEISLKDNLSKGLNDLSNKVRKVAKEMQQNANLISNAFNNIKFNNTNIDKQLSNFKNKIKNIGSESITIKANVEVDKSAVEKATASSSSSNLGNVINMTGLMGVGSSVQQVSQSISSSMGQVSENIKSSMDSVKNSISEMTVAMKEDFISCVQQTDEYKAKLNEVSDTFKIVSHSLNSLNHNASMEGIERLKNGIPHLEKLKSFFEVFEDSVDSAGISIKQLESGIASLQGLNMENLSSVAEDFKKLDSLSLQHAINETMTYEQQMQKLAQVGIQLGNAGYNKIKFDADMSSFMETQAYLESNINEIEQKLKGLNDVITSPDIDLEGYEEAMIQIDDLNEELMAFESVQANLKMPEGNSFKMEAEIKETSEEFNRLNEAINKVNKNNKELANSQDKVGKEMQETATSTESANKSVNKLSTGINKLKSIIRSILPMLSIFTLYRFGKSCVDTASQIEEVANVINVTFGEASESINAWAKESASAFGLSELSAKKYASTIGSIFKSSGMGQYIEEMSKSITQLVGDMSSFYNLAEDDAFQKIRSSLMGEVEPLRQIGINMSVKVVADRYSNVA